MMIVSLSGEAAYKKTMKGELRHGWWSNSKRNG